MWSTQTDRQTATCLHQLPHSQWQTYVRVYSFSSFICTIYVLNCWSWLKGERKSKLIVNKRVAEAENTKWSYNEMDIIISFLFSSTIENGQTTGWSALCKCIEGVKGGIIKSTKSQTALTFCFNIHYMKLSFKWLSYPAEEFLQNLLLGIIRFSQNWARLIGVFITCCY